MREPWKNNNYSREKRHLETYSKMDIDLFIKKNFGIKQNDGSYIFTKNLILLKKAPIIKNGRFIINIKKVYGNFNCSGQGLKTLEGGPIVVGGNFWCSDNPRLTSLKHAPKKIGNIFDCSYCNIKSFKILNKIKFKNLDVSGNNIKTLKGFPSNINGYFKANDNLLKSLEYMPQTVNEADFNDNTLETLYGFKIPVDNDILSFQSEHNNLTNSEIDFVLHHQYDLNKVPKNYHKELLERTVNKNKIDDLKNILWPEELIKSNEVSNSIKSLIGISKYNL